MEAERTSETSVYFNETTRRYNPEGRRIYRGYTYERHYKVFLFFNKNLVEYRRNSLLCKPIYNA
jgi:hypothetical protein